MRFLFNVLCPSFVFEVGGFDFFYLLYIYILPFSRQPNTGFQFLTIFCLWL